MSSPSAPLKKDVKNVDEAACRRSRQDNVVQLRKCKKEDSLRKKRKAVSASEAVEVAVPDVLSLDYLHNYVQACRSTDAATQLAGVSRLRRLLSADELPPVREVVMSGVLPLLVGLLSSADAKIAFEAAWALTNVASTEYTKSVLDAGALPALVAGMLHGDGAVREQCMWCIGNISGDCAELRDTVFREAAYTPNLLANVSRPDNIKLLRTATWSMSNVFRGKPAPALAAVAPFLPALAWLVSNEDAEVLSDSLWGLCYLSDSDERLIEAVVSAGVLPRAVALLSHANAAVAMPALRLIGNTISAADAPCQAAIDAGAIAALVPLLSSAKRTVRREACWAVSNAAAGTAAQIGAVLATPGLLPAVVSLLSSPDWTVRKEAAWIVCNTAAAGTPEHVCRIVASGVIEPLVDILKTDDARMLLVVLDAMEAILCVEARFVAAGNPAAAMCRFAERFEECGGRDRLEELQDHTDADIYKKSLALLGKYYYAGEEAGAGSAENAGASAAAPAPPTAVFCTSGIPAVAGMGMAPMQLNFGSAFAAAAAKVAAPPVAASASAFSFGSAVFA